MRHKSNEKNRIYRTLCVFLSICLGALLLSGCGRGKKSEVTGTFICYMNMEGTALVKEEYEVPDVSVDTQIEKIFQALQTEGDSENYRSVFSEGVKVEDWKFTDTKLSLYFNSGYHNMPVDTEVLFRSAIVQSLGQIEGIDYIDFYVDDEPLVDAEGQIVGYMRPDDFVQNTGSSLHSYQMGDFTLYFANEKGDKLVAKEVSVRYNSNMSKEKVIIEQLLKGPSEDGLAAVIPPETKVLGISVRDNICYVNLDEGFLEDMYVADPGIIVYSIVDSMIENGVSAKVQILVNGETDIKYMDAIDLSKPLELNGDLIAK